LPRLNVACRLDEAMRKWICLRSHREYHRVAKWMEVDDLIQDGYMIFAKCRLKYSGKITERRHFMALVKTAFNNHITDLANARSIYGRNEPGGEIALSHLFPDVDVSEWFAENGAMIEPEAELEYLQGEAKFPVSAAIQLFTTEAGSELLRERPQMRRETLNRYMCRLIGVDAEEYDLPALIRSFLSGQGMYYMRRLAAQLALPA
jgi:hypothetical protein